MKTKTYQVYRWEDLPENEKEKFRENGRRWLGETCDWWEFALENIQERLLEVGIEGDNFNFSLDRENYFNGNYRIDDLELFTRKVNLNSELILLELLEGEMDIDISRADYGNYCEVEIYNQDLEHQDGEEINLKLSIEEKINDYLNDLNEQNLNILKKEEEYAFGEGIEERLVEEEFIKKDDGKFEYL